MSGTKAATITCDSCKRVYDFDDDAVDGAGSADCLPDGYLVSGLWICDECGSCSTCGMTKVDYKPKCDHAIPEREADGIRWKEAA